MSAQTIEQWVSTLREDAELVVRQLILIFLLIGVSLMFCLIVCLYLLSGLAQWLSFVGYSSATVFFIIVAISFLGMMLFSFLSRLKIKRLRFLCAERKSIFQDYKKNAKIFSMVLLPLLIGYGFSKSEKVLPEVAKVFWVGAATSAIDFFQKYFVKTSSFHSL